MRMIDFFFIFNSGEFFYDVISSLGRCWLFGIFISGFLDLLLCVMFCVSLELIGWIKSRVKVFFEFSKR